MCVPRHEEVAIVDDQAPARAMARLLAWRALRDRQTQRDRWEAYLQLPPRVIITSVLLFFSCIAVTCILLPVLYNAGLIRELTYVLLICIGTGILIPFVILGLAFIIIVAYSSWKSARLTAEIEVMSREMHNI